MIVAGIGFRRGTSADEIERVVRLALGLHELPAERLQAIATESEKAVDPALPEVARRLSARLVACTVGDDAAISQTVAISSAIGPRAVVGPFAPSTMTSIGLPGSNGMSFWAEPKRSS